MPGFGVTGQAINDLTPDAEWYVTDIAAGALGLCASVLALALVQHWGQMVPRWLLAGAAWIGGVVAGGYGYAGLVTEGLYGTGRLTAATAHQAMASGWWFYWYALFAAMGTGLAATAWLTRHTHAKRWQRHASN